MDAEDINMEPEEFNPEHQYGWCLEISDAWAQDMQESERATIDRIVKDNMEQFVPKEHRRRVKFFVVRDEDIGSSFFVWKYTPREINKKS